MKKEITKKQIGETLPQVMEKYGCLFFIQLSVGFAHLRFVDGEMVVSWLNDEGCVKEDWQEVPRKDIERVANFMREMKELRLADYQKP